MTHDPSSMATPSPPQEPLGRSEPFLFLMEAISRAAKVDRPVLLVGERGTGKELAAARLHYLSPRWNQPLVALNCAALAPGLIESELFGHEAGAFTGAASRRLGRFESAQGGTLFLDEVGSIPLTVQEKILRVVEYGAMERVGSSRQITVDVRLVGATNADLPRLARAGEFKQDLLDRLSFEVLTLPPLRARGEDIELLAQHFARRMAGELGLAQPPRFSPAAWSRLLAYPWPGNVRQLKNVVERAVYRQGQEGEITEVEFDPFASPYAPTTEPAPPSAPSLPAPPAAPAAPAPGPLPLDFKAAVRALETDLLTQALAQARHNQRSAAALLGLSYHQLRGLMRTRLPQKGQG